MSVISFRRFKSIPANLNEIVSTFKEITPQLNKNIKPLKKISNSHELTCSEYYLMSILESFKSQFGFNYVCWFECYNQEIDYLSTYPEAWIQCYLKEYYQDKDQIIQEALAKLNPFMWTSTLDTNLLSKNQQLLALAAQYDIKSGITIPLAFGDNKLSGLSFSSASPLIEFEKFLKSKVNNLMLLSHLFHMLLKAHQAGFDSMEDTHQVITSYKEHLKI